MVDAQNLEQETPSNQPVEKSVPVVESIVPASAKSTDLNSIIEQEMSRVSLVTDGGSTPNIVPDSRVDHQESDVVSKGTRSASTSSKNAIKVLPPVPQVHEKLQPHHQLLPVGIVLGTIGNRVIVEGDEKPGPLNEGSILWITESRSPLGLVDEIFGLVKNPHYSVRYNSESEVPTGIGYGTHVSYVLEFSDNVLNNKDVDNKGYDASDDVEVTDVGFSDDEKEQATIPSPQQATIPEGGRSDQPTLQQANMDMVQPSFYQTQRVGPPVAPSMYHGGHPNPSAAHQSVMPYFVYDPYFVYNPYITPAQGAYQFPHQQIPLFHNNPPMRPPYGVAYPQEFVGTSYPLTRVGAQGVAYPNGNLQPETQQFYHENSQSPVTMPGYFATPQQFNQYSASNWGRGSYSYPNQYLQPETQQFYHGNSQSPVTMPGVLATPQHFEQDSASNLGRGSYSHYPNQNLQPETQQFYHENSQSPVTMPGILATPQEFDQGSSSNRERRSYRRGGYHFGDRRGGRQTR